MDLFLYNTRARRKEIFTPIQAGQVGLYTCGPTVYHYAHIGNLRTYVFEDLLVRALRYFGYRVRQVMNVTDVGHLTDDADAIANKIRKARTDPEPLPEGHPLWTMPRVMIKRM